MPVVSRRHAVVRSAVAADLSSLIESGGAQRPPPRRDTGPDRAPVAAPAVASATRPGNVTGATKPPATASAIEPVAAVGARRLDLWAVLALTVLVYAVSSALELHERYVPWLARHEHWQADELPLSLLVLAAGLAVVAFRRQRLWHVELLARRQAEARAAILLAHNRELSQQLIAVQEKERLAIARELHDELGQCCHAIRVETAYMRHARSDDRAGLMAAAQRADAAALGLYGSLRELLLRLRPANLDTLGLATALQALCETWEERSGVACTFHHEGMLDGLGDALDITVYRITQEALTNVARHAKADSVRVRLQVDAVRGLRLLIEDDGQGTGPDPVGRGLGLLGATERAAAVGGSLSVDTAPGRGLRLAMTVPATALAEAAP